MIVAVTSNKPDADPEAITRFRRDIARRQVAYLTALRLQLRAQLDTTEGRRELTDRSPLIEIRRIHCDRNIGRGTFGVRKVWNELCREKARGELPDGHGHVLAARSPA